MTDRRGVAGNTCAASMPPSTDTASLADDWGQTTTRQEPHSLTTVPRRDFCIELLVASGIAPEPAAAAYEPNTR